MKPDEPCSTLSHLIVMTFQKPNIRQGFDMRQCLSGAALVPGQPEAVWYIGAGGEVFDAWRIGSRCWGFLHTWKEEKMREKRHASDTSQNGVSGCLNSLGVVSFFQFFYWTARVICKIYFQKMCTFCFHLNHCIDFLWKYTSFWITSSWIICHLGSIWKIEDRPYVAASIFRLRELQFFVYSMRHSCLQSTEGEGLLTVFHVDSSETEAIPQGSRSLLKLIFKVYWRGRSTRYQYGVSLRFWIFWQSNMLPGGAKGHRN